MSCAYATEFVHRWSHLKVIGDPCDQGRFDRNENRFVLNVNIILIFYISFITVISLFSIGFYIRRRKLCNDQQNVEKKSTNQYNDCKDLDKINHFMAQPDYGMPISAEPIYWEIESISDTYDHLMFQEFQSSTIKSHYQFNSVVEIGTKSGKM